MFRITPSRDLQVSRTIELKADQTLHDLHWATQNAFELDDDHLYAFFLNNRAWDRSFEYGDPRGTFPRYADAVPLGELPLRPNKRFLYVFDFGDELHHEVRFVGEGTPDADGPYPRVVERIGAAPPQYPVFDEGEEYDHPELPPLAPGMAELVPGVKRALERYAPRRFEVGTARARPQAELREEAELATALLDRGAGSHEKLHAVEHAVEGNILGWLCDLPLELSLAGMTGEGLRLGERLQAILPGPPLAFTIPLLLALADSPGEARSALDRNLAEHPDDFHMLLRAGDAFQALGELGRAEEAYRDALHWVGDDTRTRREIVGGLELVLSRLGREDAVAELRGAQRLELERQIRERMSGGPPTYRRPGPKVGRNDPCPCGSGKKLKRCCGSAPAG